jgi:GT2 family glycosyltransferase
MMTVEPKVAVLIPTFNRKDITLDCIAALKSQSRQPDVIVVSDGGSTDGTREVVAERYPGVTVLKTPQDAWWGGAMAHGFEHLVSRLDGHDRILMLNDDTLLPSDYIKTLLEVSVGEDAAVCGVTVDAADPRKVLDSGEYIEWRRYVYHVCSDWPEDLFRDDVDVLPGRGTMITVEMVRTVGNVDHKSFPHYISDYDLTVRIKKAGFRLAVTGRTWVGCMTESTGLSADTQTKNVRSLVRLLTSRRSMQRPIDHWRFIWRHAPGYRMKTRLIVLTALHGGKTFLASASPWGRSRNG